MTKESLADRIRAQALHKAGWSVRRIAQEIGRPRSFVQYWKDQDSTVPTKVSGRPAKVTTQVKQTIVRKIKMNPKTKKPTSERQVARQVGLSKDTVPRVAKEAGLKPFRALKNPSIER